jgi:hypothetical protein
MAPHALLLLVVTPGTLHPLALVGLGLVVLTLGIVITFGHDKRPGK